MEQISKILSLIVPHVARGSRRSHGSEAALMQDSFAMSTRRVDVHMLPSINSTPSKLSCR